MSRGFTLIEIMVAVSIFAVVAVMTAGALLAAHDANRQAEALQLAMDSVDFALDSITLNSSFGLSYACEESGSPWSGWSAAVDGFDLCSAGSGLYFKTQRLDAGSFKGRIYRFRTVNGRGLIQFANENDCPGASGAAFEDCFVDLTPSAVDVKSLGFYVRNVSPENWVVLSVQGQAVGRQPVDFYLQSAFESTIF